MPVHELDYGIPLSYLKSERRRLVENLADLDQPPTTEQIQEIASVHLAIAAAEAVIAENDSMAPSIFDPGAMIG